MCKDKRLINYYKRYVKDRVIIVYIKASVMHAAKRIINSFIVLIIYACTNYYFSPVLL